MTKILTFGSFDHIHKGHIYYLEKAKKLGTELHIILARDNTIKKVKGQLPKYNQKQRLKHLKDLKITNNIHLGYEKDYFKVLDDIKPDLICLGYDQRSFTKDLEKELKKRNLKTKIIRIPSYKPEIYKSSKLKNY
jgi:FAD synthetase